MRGVWVEFICMKKRFIFATFHVKNWGCSCVSKVVYQRGGCMRIEVKDVSNLFCFLSYIWLEVWWLCRDNIPNEPCNYARCGLCFVLGCCLISEFFFAKVLYFCLQISNKDNINYKWQMQI